MSEYLAIADQDVPLNQAATFTASIPCRNGLVFHEDGSGIFLLRGIVRSPYIPFARYRVVFNGNLYLPDDGTPGPIAVALAVNGEPRTGSVAIVTPAAVDEPFNVTSVASILIPRGTDLTVSLRHIAPPTAFTATPAPVISIANGNLIIDRVA